jgi:hypothetical protein
LTGVFVLTSPRKTGDDRWRYVRAVFAAAENEKISNPRWLVVDGTADDAAELSAIAGPTWGVVRYERPDGQWLGGNKWPYWRLLELAHELTPPGDEALLLEDDLEFAPNALLRMLTLQVPRDVNAISFFAGFLFKQPQMPPGLWRTPAPAPGCQAIKFSRTTLELLTRWKTVDDEWQKYNESDVALQLAHERLRLRFASHLPDVVQHVGNVSAVAHGMMGEAGIDGALELAAADRSLVERTSVNYVGPHFDCLRLFARHDRYL